MRLQKASTPHKHKRYPLLQKTEQQEIVKFLPFLLKKRWPFFIVKLTIPLSKTAYTARLMMTQSRLLDEDDVNRHGGVCPRALVRLDFKRLFVF